MKHTLRVTRALAVLVAWCLVGSSAHATASPEMRCQATRYRAAGRYARCQAHAQAYREKSANFSVYQFRASKCRDRYRAKWARLQARFPATSCAAPRFVDNGATVTDNLTGLQWEKKTNLDATPNGADPHDADNTYTWCADVNLDFQCDNAGGPGDGTAFTGFLFSLDNGACFAGQCDWRLPTSYELQTILAGPFPCTTLPCIDPVFGPTQADIYWSSTSYDNFALTNAWFVEFGQGVVGINAKALNTFVRAVRGGL
jgi:hypothetical protein